MIHFNNDGLMTIRGYETSYKIVQRNTKKHHSLNKILEFTLELIFPKNMKIFGTLYKT